MIKILIADDQELIRQSLLIILRTKSGFKVTDAVKNGLEVIQSIRKEKPNVVLMDIRMPVMSGYDAAKTIRAMKERADVNLPIIAMTADAFSEDIQHSLECGMNEHISKPIDVDRLIQILRKYLK